MPHARVEPTMVAVTPRHRADDGSNWLQISVPNGWEDVKKLTKKVLSFEGRTYTFMSWNSDTLVCNFKATDCVAKIVRR